MTDPTASSAPIAAPKADPETLVLRAAPGRVTRFRRGAIVAIVGVLVGVIGAAVGVAAVGSNEGSGVGATVAMHVVLESGSVMKPSRHWHLNWFAARAAALLPPPSTPPPHSQHAWVASMPSAFAISPMPPQLLSHAEPVPPVAVHQFSEAYCAHGYPSLSVQCEGEDEHFESVVLKSCSASADMRTERTVIEPHPATKTILPSLSVEVVE